MEQGKVVLQLLQDRIREFNQLKELLLQQQRALVSVDTEKVTCFAELQINCMERIQALEARWREIVEKVKLSNNISGNTSDLIVALGLNDHDSTLAFAYLDQLKKTTREIMVVKKNNSLLIHNSLSLVRSTLNQLQGEPKSAALYNPFRKPAQQHILLNKKL